MPRRGVWGFALCWCAVAGCAGERMATRETFAWHPQPISFSPPPPIWYREGENQGGMAGVRFVLRGGLGQCITVASYYWVADRDRCPAIQRLIDTWATLSQQDFLHEVSLARARTDDPWSDADATASLALNDALNRATDDYLNDRSGLVRSDLESALAAAQSYEPTLAELLPRIRLRPETMQEPDRWRIAYERDTTLAGRPAFASDDTLITPERPLLYHEVFWVVNRCAFKATYQGTRAHLGLFNRLVASIQFPDSTSAPTN